ncbi:polysaccharide lyase [Parafrankia sp. FMc2]|uniref:polysaccharide lyase n=1 Tax=Parafrankia sp. FMc2 TaxID=3233196 RepID=UPI0034D409D2
MLASSLGVLGLAAGAGCGALTDDQVFDPASEILPPDTTAPAAGPATTAPAAGVATGRTLADPAAAREFFGRELVPQTRSSFGLDRAAIMASDDPRFPQFLRVAIPVDAMNPSDARIYGDGPTYGGTQLFVDHTLRSPYELYLRYYLRFPETFDFGNGGRLPGFFGTIVKDRRRTETMRSGLATRFAWREGGKGIVYANTAREDHPVNVIGKGSWYWPRGRWACVEQGVKLNFEGFADGVILMWLDGQLMHKESFNPRISSDLRIGGILATATFGDGGASFAPTTTQAIDLAGFAYGIARLNPLPRPEET